MKQFLTKYWYYVVAVLMVIIFGTIWGVWAHRAFKNVEDDASKVTIARDAWYQVELNGKVLFYYNELDSDSIFKDINALRDSTITRTYSYGRWMNNHWWMPSCKGRIIAALDSIKQPKYSTQQVLEKNKADLEDKISDMGKMLDEMEYFLGVHSVQDAGFELVTAKYEETIAEKKRLEALLSKIDTCLGKKGVKFTHRQLLWTKHIADESERKSQSTKGNGKNDNSTKEAIAKRDTLVFTGSHFQLLQRKTPSSVKPISFRKKNGLNLRYTTIIKSAPVEEVLNGFALKVSAKKGVQLGEWKDGKFRGERLQYNNNRIYGIDLSRYQHEVGRRRYAINWKNLRITSLGHLSKKNVSGTVDYPVSFCYIKSTQGASIKNKYYAGDYVQARKHGLHVGTYHFFSTKTSGALQARFFLKNLRLHSSDLPPVLDVEPTAAQIAKMGGVQKMFREIRAWLNKVEASTGMRPILYISQSFVNRYLSQAPDLKQNYGVWIARYGEYKPDVHMFFWQLSPDGHVRGIKPEVDINVFNGYKERYNEFLRTRK